MQFPLHLQQQNSFTENLIFCLVAFEKQPINLGNFLNVNKAPHKDLSSFAFHTFQVTYSSIQLCCSHFSGHELV